MKKRIIIGDVHGRWEAIKKIYDNEQPDEVIILGDYFDSLNIDAYTQRDCYLNIKKLHEEHLSKNKGRFEMLIGDHDMHYLDESFGRCSSWNPLTCSLANELLENDFNNNILKYAFIDKLNNVIYSHAGISQKWLERHCNGYLGNMEDLMPKDFVFTDYESGETYTHSPWNSPVWIHPEALKTSPFIDKDDGVMWSQIFGHTECDTPMYWKNKKADFYDIDCGNRYYIVEELDEYDILEERKIMKLN